MTLLAASSLATLLLLSAQAAAAEDSQEDAELVGCIDAANANDFAMRDCYLDLNAREDVAMNVAWKRLMEVVGGRTSSSGAALVIEQRAWLAYRDAACHHFDISGTLNRLLGAMCLANLTSSRVSQLKDYTLYYNGGEY